MRSVDYIKDKTGILLLNGAGMLLLAVFLFSLGNPASSILLILIAWMLILFVYLFLHYLERRHYFNELERLLDELDARYLLAEVMKPSWRQEDQIYREILRRSNKSVIEKIHQLENKQREYKEYIESWIHEAKIPITAMHLLCENLEASDSTRRLKMELGKMENLVEMVLYYARMERTYQDYLIVKTPLRRVVLNAIQKNRIYFIENQMQIDLQMEEIWVSTDEKWVIFLLNQIFSNCIKYRRETDAKISIYTKRQENGLSLIVEDNGCGIRPEELGRIFQKGFSGSNGRKTQHSTGIGLYLCARLCDKLKIGIHAESTFARYTRIILTFPDSDFQKIEENFHF